MDMQKQNNTVADKTLQKYPIYSRSVSCYEKIPEDKLNDEWYIGRSHPEHEEYFLNYHMYYNQMYREDPGEEFVLQELKEVWANRQKPIDCFDVKFEVKKIDEEEWCLTWFAHYTFDIGQSDEEVLRSFEDFLLRKKIHISYGYDPYSSILNDDSGYCAMGAEDRWRWKGRKTADCNSELVDPPCRCNGCKERGIITIQH